MNINHSKKAMEKNMPVAFLKHTKKAISIFFILLFTSCANKAQYVYIPQKCNIEKPKKPVVTKNIVLDIKQVFIYAELLEKHLEFCIGSQRELPLKD